MNYRTVKSWTEKIPSPIMTFNGNNVITKKHLKSGKTMMSRGLIPLNEVFNM